MRCGELEGEQCVSVSLQLQLGTSVWILAQLRGALLRTECTSDHQDIRYFISATGNGSNNGCVYFLLAASEHEGKEFILPMIPS